MWDDSASIRYHILSWLVALVALCITAFMVGSFAILPYILFVREPSKTVTAPATVTSSESPAAIIEPVVPSRAVSPLPLATPVQQAVPDAPPAPIVRPDAPKPYTPPAPVVPVPAVAPEPVPTPDEVATQDLDSDAISETEAVPEEPPTEVPPEEPLFRTQGLPRTSPDPEVSTQDTVAEPADAGRLAIVLRSVNLRSRPGGPQIGVLRRGDAVEVVQCDGWCEVVVNGRRAFVYGRYLGR